MIRRVPVSSEHLPPGEVSVEDAAAYLKVSDETVRRYISLGRIEARVEQGSVGSMGWRYVIPTEELARLRRLSRRVVVHRLQP